jgi:hypothetical protein
MPVFHKVTEKKLFLLTELLHFTNNEGYDGHVPPKIYKAKPMFDHLMQRVSQSYVTEDELSTDESLLQWKG